MSFPSPEQLDVLSKCILRVGEITNKKWNTYAGALQILSLASGDIAKGAAGGVAKAGVNALGAAAGVGTASALAPLGAALAPWIAVMEIARQAGDISDLYDLVDHAKRAPSNDGLRYKCVCGQCAKNIQYICDKKDRNVGLIALAVFTFGVSSMVKTAHSAYKSKYGAGDKTRVCKALVESARNGCTTAIAAIFVVSGNWQKLRGGNVGTMNRATAVIVSEDGWEALKKSW